MKKVLGLHLVYSKDQIDTFRKITDKFYALSKTIDGLTISGCTAAGANPYDIEIIFSKCKIKIEFSNAEPVLTNLIVLDEGDEVIITPKGIFSIQDVVKILILNVGS